MRRAGAGGQRAEYVGETEQGPGDQGWRWCHEQLVKVGVAPRDVEIEEVVQLAELLTTLALHCITEDAKRQEFTEAVRRISVGEPLDLGDGVILHTR